MPGLFVDADEGIQPSLLAVPVELPLTDHKTGIQPGERGILSGELQPGKNRPQRPRAVLVDALIMARQQEFAAATVRMKPRRLGVQTPSSRRRG
jgi:hypothetical protein